MKAQQKILFRKDNKCNNWARRKIEKSSKRTQREN